MVKTLTRPENWVNKFELDLNGGQDPVADVTKAEWAPISQGLQTATPAGNETADTQAFWNDKGFSETDVTGKRVTFALTFQRVVGDEAQDFIASKFLEMGDALRTLFRWTDQSGKTILANATMTAIVPFGGNANARQTMSCTLSLNGKPVIGTGGTSNDDGTGLNGTVSGGTTSLGDGEDIGNAGGTTTPVISKADVKVKDSSIKVGDTWKPADNFVSGTNKAGQEVTAENVVVGGTVDTTKAGENKITYTIDDAVQTATVTVTA
ncbi:phage tail tube protein [Companilactobacillus mishanensis]|uniref:Ig-like domain-containing protein n=1 Tax=Companilactobacillus mishanensis TaxID=2486008 RepID=A0ABW9P4Z0_9LACO|nr:bacterial Ig-like domain-containing protein [Companilactobacillus mishanensis]MQS44243.1 hypothetical protein [Companilactobacillus mishanensis]